MRSVFVALMLTMLLAGCGEDYNRPALPMTGGNMTTTFGPDGSKVIVMNTPGGGQRQIIVDKLGTVVSDKYFDAPPAPPAAMESVRSASGARHAPMSLPRSGRDQACQPCRVGYFHSPRPGSPCGCGR